MWIECKSFRDISVASLSPHCSLTVIQPILRTLVDDGAWKPNFQPSPFMCACTLMSGVALDHTWSKVSPVGGQGPAQTWWYWHTSPTLVAHLMSISAVLNPSPHGVLCSRTKITKDIFSLLPSPPHPEPALHFCTQLWCSCTLPPVSAYS